MMQIYLEIAWLRPACSDRAKLLRRKEFKTLDLSELNFPQIDHKIRQLSRL